MPDVLIQTLDFAAEDQGKIDVRAPEYVNQREDNNLNIVAGQV